MNDPEPGELDPRWIGAAIFKQHWHFHRQLLDRYGVVLAPGEFSSMMHRIENCGMRPVERREDGSAIYSIKVRKGLGRIYVLFKEGCLVTAWPRERRLQHRLQRQARLAIPNELGHIVAEEPGQMELMDGPAETRL